MVFLARRVIFLARNIWATKLLYTVHEINYSYDLRKKHMIFQMVKLMHGLRENMDKKSWLKYYTCPGATDSVNMSEVDSVVENFVKDALSQCDKSTVGETFKRVH